VLKLIKKILIVDDEESIREITKHHLNKTYENAEIDVAVDGIEGLEKFFSSDYELLITDITMPKLDGIEMYGMIRSKGYNPKTIFITGYTANTEKLETILEIFPNTRKLNKPFRMPVLIETISGLYR